MGQVIMPSVAGATSLDEVKNAVGIMIKELSWLLNNLDTRNVNELNAEVIIAGSIVADKIAAGAITAEKIDVDELSAISADLGKITAGEVYGAYIATRENAYPRSEMSSEKNMFGVYKSSSEFINMESYNVANSSPQLGFVGGSSGLYMTQTGLNSLIQTINSKLNIFADGDVDFILNDPFDSVLVDFNQLEDKMLGTTLYQQLLGKAKSGVSTSLSGSANGGIPIGTVLMVSGGGTVTWNGIPSHSHTQN